MGRQTKVNFGTTHYTEAIMNYEHMETWGPTKIAPLGDLNWFASFMDAYSRRVWVYPMHHKNEALKVFLN